MDTGARTKGIGAENFRARLVDGALTATVARNPRPGVAGSWAALLLAGHHTATTQSLRRVTPTATTSAARSRARSTARRGQPSPGRRHQVQAERASVEHRERVPPRGAARRNRAGVAMEHSEQEPKSLGG